MKNFWTLCLFCCTLIGTTLHAQPATGELFVSGVVTYGEDGSPARGLPVWITVFDGTTTEMRTLTNAEGYYEFNMVTLLTSNLDSIGFSVETIDFCTGRNQIQSIAFAPGSPTEFEINFNICEGLNPPMPELGCQAFFLYDQMTYESPYLVQFHDLSFSREPVEEWIWEVVSTGDTLMDPAPVFEFEEPGVYPIQLTIKSGMYANDENLFCNSSQTIAVVISEEPCDCPDRYEPVCMVDEQTGEKTTFINRCWAKCGGIDEDQLSPCNDCICPLVFDPVCTIVDGEYQQFDNLCLALCAGIPIDNITDCDTTVCRCPDVYDPICVILPDGSTQRFTSPCEAACLGYNQFVPCDSTYTECQAAFFMENPDPDNPFLVLFNDISRTPDNAPVIAWKWDFGDGNEGEGPSPVHQYEREGVFEVVLTIVTQNGCLSRTAQSIRIGDPSDCQCPQIYDPICIKLDDGLVTTYPNACEARCAGFGEDQFTPCDTTNTCACPEYYDPVCVTLSNGEIRVFSNICFAICEGYISAQPCRPGNCVCTNEYDPVCTVIRGDTLQFANKCLALCEGVAEDALFKCDSTTVCPCSREYNPVCVATPSGMILTFNNPCLAECAGFPADIHYPCDPNECICPEYYDPVCVVLADGTVKEFSNKCFARCEGYDEDQLVSCNLNCICPDVYDPVCVITFDGEFIEFGNQCEAECLGYSEEHIVECPQDCTCPTYYDPVCVNTASGEVLTFSNPCYAACEGFSEADFIPCDSVCVCPEIYAPVCVFLDDGTKLDFPNACEAKCAGYGDDQIQRCDDDCICPQVFAPVCVQLPNGEIKQFPNTCYAACAGYARDQYVNCYVCDCTAEYDPVCVVDMVTGQLKRFHNRCEAECNGYNDYFECPDGSSCYAHFRWEMMPTNDGLPIVQFYDQSPAGGAEIISRKWDFGDGNASSEATPQHQYPEAGAYTVSLTIETPDGCTSTTSQLIIVRGDDGTTAPRCQALFYFRQHNDRRNTFTFLDESLGEVIAWEWNFGDGQISNEPNPTHTYQNAGTYLVTLTVKTERCESKTRMLLVTDEDIWYDSTCTALFAPIPNPNDFSVFFLNLSSEDAEAYLWEFGDGNTSREAVPVHHYDRGGTYEISLTITTAEGCTSKFSVTISFDDAVFISAPAFETTTNVEESNVVQQVSLYPNPAQELVNIQLETNRQGEALIAVYNMQGQRLIDQTIQMSYGLSTHTLDVNNLTPGMYLVQIRMANEQQTLKLMIAE